jgi:protein-tyrosine phosphatase
MPSVLFVCTANRFRSPIAAAAFTRQLKKAGIEDEWVVSSAGTWATTGLPPVQLAIQTAAELGLDIKDCTASLVNQADLAKYDLILVMEAGQKEAINIEFSPTGEKVYLLTEVASGDPYDIPDPFDGNQDEEKQDIARELYDLINSGFKKICDLAQQLQMKSFQD